MKITPTLATAVIAVIACQVNALDLTPSVNNVCQLNGIHQVSNQQTDTNSFFAFGVSETLLNRLITLTPVSQTTEPAINVLRDMKNNPKQHVFENSCKQNNGIVTYEWAKNINGDGGKSFPICVWFDQTYSAQDVALGFGFATILIDQRYFMANNGTDVFNSNIVTYTYEVANRARQWIQSDSRTYCPAIDNKTFTNLKNSF
jgi:hypothetical protein